MDGSLLPVIRSLQSWSCSLVHIASNKSDAFQFAVGLQGCALSPVLVIVFMGRICNQESNATESGSVPFPLEFLQLVQKKKKPSAFLGQFAAECKGMQEQGHGSHPQKGGVHIPRWGGVSPSAGAFLVRCFRHVHCGGDPEALSRVAWECLGKPTLLPRGVDGGSL